MSAQPSAPDPSLSARSPQRPSRCPLRCRIEGAGAGAGAGEGSRRASRPPNAHGARVVSAAPHWPLAAGASSPSPRSPPSSPPPRAPPIAPSPAPPSRPVPPLAEGHTAAADCAACHPRQAAEWRRSVMAHAVKSPLFNALESLIEEQVGRDDDCPERRRHPPQGEQRDGVPRRADGRAGHRLGRRALVRQLPQPDREARRRAAALGGSRGRATRGRGGRCAISSASAAWRASRAGSATRSTGRCRRARAARGGYEGNATWTSFVTGATFAARPEDGRGLTGIGNSGYDLDPGDFLLGGARPGVRRRSVGAHLRPPRATRAYLALERVLRELPRRAPLRHRHARRGRTASTSSGCATPTRSGSPGRAARRAPAARRPPARTAT